MVVTLFSGLWDTDELSVKPKHEKIKIKTAKNDKKL